MIFVSLQTSKDVRIVALALRLLTDLITSAPQLPALASAFLRGSSAPSSLRLKTAQVVAFLRQQLQTVLGLSSPW